MTALLYGLVSAVMSSWGQDLRVGLVLATSLHLDSSAPGSRSSSVASG